MSDLFGEKSEGTLSPEDLCRQAFCRCGNWPVGRLEQQGLYQGLATASARFGVPQDQIVAKCRETSAWCPTDADLWHVAEEIYRERNRESERKPGPPPWMRLPSCEVCDSTGWEPLTRGQYSAVRRCPNGCAVPDQMRFGGGA